MDINERIHVVRIDRGVFNQDDLKALNDDPGWIIRATFPGSRFEKLLVTKSTRPGALLEVRKEPYTRAVL